MTFIRPSVYFKMASAGTCLDLVKQVGTWVAVLCINGSQRMAVDFQCSQQEKAITEFIEYIRTKLADDPRAGFKFMDDQLPEEYSSGLSLLAQSKYERMQSSGVPAERIQIVKDFDRYRSQKAEHVDEEETFIKFAVAEFPSPETSKEVDEAVGDEGSNKLVKASAARAQELYTEAIESRQDLIQDSLKDVKRLLDEVCNGLF